MRTLVLLLAGCAAMHVPDSARPPRGDEAEAWALVVAEWGEDSSLPSASDCEAPAVAWAETHDEASALCGYPPETAWGCYRAPSPRHPYVVAWTGHRAPMGLLVHEYVHALEDCTGHPRSAWTPHADERLWGPDGVEKRTRGRL